MLTTRRELSQKIVKIEFDAPFLYSGPIRRHIKAHYGA
jgi:hypothetical protein